jgi:hypothetical protein
MASFSPSIRQLLTPLSEESPLKLPSDHRKAIQNGETFLRGYALQRFDRQMPSPEADITPYSSKISESCHINIHTGQNRRTESEQGTSREKNTFSSDIIIIGTNQRDTAGKVVFQQGTNARVTHEEHSLKFGTAGKGTHQPKADEQ